ncbi:MAG: sulfatase-like hydrolase/transferase [Cyclobacteriaceae bacterium]
MKNRLIMLIIALFSVVNTEASDRPNIIFIFADDLGWGDLGCYGHNRLKTPSLDQMANEGMILTNFYVANPVCSPSRTAVMTGQYPARHHIHQHLSHHKHNSSLDMPDFLNPGATLLTRLMQAGGYKTGHFGKWHLGHTENSPSPSAYGIDVHYTYNSSEVKITCPRHESTEKMVDEAIAFIERNKEENFYVNLWTLVPHATLDPTNEQMAPYEKMAPKGVVKARGFSIPRQIYYGAVTDMDFHIGRLLDRLDELGLSKNTIVVFSSDNGPEDINIGNSSHSGVGSPGPLRGRKRSLYDGGVRVPFIVKWEGQTPAGIVDDMSIVGAVDLLPTFCNLAGVELPEGYQSDGQDMTPVFKGEKVERVQPLLWDWTGSQWGHTFNKSPGLALRSGKWKFLMNPDGSRVELYDFEADPQFMELDNVAEQHPELISKFSNILLDFKASIPHGVSNENSGSNNYPMPASSVRPKNKTF